MTDPQTQYQRLEDVPLNPAGAEMAAEARRWAGSINDPKGQAIFEFAAKIVERGVSHPLHALEVSLWVANQRLKEAPEGFLEFVEKLKRTLYDGIEMLVVQ